MNFFNCFLLQLFSLLLDLFCLNLFFLASFENSAENHHYSQFVKPKQVQIRVIDATLDYLFFILLYCRWKGLCENFLKNLNNHCLPENSRSPNPIYTAYFYTFCLRNRRSELCYTFSDQRQLFFLVTRRKLLHRDDDGDLAYSSLNISSYPIRTRIPDFV